MMDDDEKAKTLAKFMVEAMDTLIAAMPKPEGLEDWEYKDIPWMAPEFWMQLTEILGEGNFRILAMSRRSSAEHGRAVRGQMFISPTGMANLVKYTQANRKVH